MLQKPISLITPTHITHKPVDKFSVGGVLHEIIVGPIGWWIMGKNAFRFSHDESVSLDVSKSLEKYEEAMNSLSSAILNTLKHLIYSCIRS